MVVEVDLIRLGIPESGLKLGVARALWITNLEVRLVFVVCCVMSSV